MLHDPAAVRSAWDAATAAFLKTISAIAPDALSAPGLGEWTVLELLAHTCRAFTTVEEYLASPPDPALARLDSAVAYYRDVFDHADPDLHARVAARARAAVAGLGDDPIAGAVGIANRTLDLVHRTADDHPCTTMAGTMTLQTYLPTRVVELAIHTRDLQRATGQVRSMPPVVRALVTEVLVELVDRTSEPEVLIDVLTGRADPDASINVLA